MLAIKPVNSTSHEKLIKVETGHAAKATKMQSCMGTNEERKAATGVEHADR